MTDTGRPAASWRRELRLLRYARPHTRAIVLLTATMLIDIGLELAQPWPLKILVDDVLGHHQPSGLVHLLPGSHSSQALALWAALATVAIYGLGAASQAFYTYASLRLGQSMVVTLAGDVFAHLQRLSLRFHQRGSLGDTIARVTGDTYCVSTLVTDAVIPLAQAARDARGDVRGHVDAATAADARGAWRPAVAHPGVAVRLGVGSRGHTPAARPGGRDARRGRADDVGRPRRAVVHARAAGGAALPGPGRSDRCRLSACDVGRAALRAARRRSHHARYRRDHLRRGRARVAWRADPGQHHRLPRLPAFAVRTAGCGHADRSDDPGGAGGGRSRTRGARGRAGGR